MERARGLLAPADEEGQWLETSGDNADIDSGGSVRRHAWRYRDEIINSSRYREEGVAVSDAGRAGSENSRFAELSVKGRMTRTDSICGGPDQDVFTLGISITEPLHMFY